MPLSTHLSHRQELRGKLEALNAAAAGRKFTNDEQKAWDATTRALDLLAVRIAEAQELESAMGSGRMTPVSPVGALTSPSDAEFRDLGHGVGAVGPGASVAAWAAARGLTKHADRPASFGEWALSLMRGDHAILAGLQGDVNTAGGFAVPFAVSAQIIDLARAQSVCVAAGAQTIPVVTREFTFPRLAADPAAAWVGESATIPEDSQTRFDAITGQIHKLTSLVLASKELVQDVEEFSRFMENALAEALALKIDLAALRGSGVEQPLGIRSFSGVNVVSMGANGATPTNFDPIVDAITAVRVGNFDPTAWIGTPRDAGTFGKLKDTTNQPLRPPADVAALRRFTTTQLPIDLVQGTSGAVTSEAYIGDFSQLAFVIRIGFEVQILMERYADTGQIGFLATLRADATPVRETAFAVITGIKP